MKCTLIGAVLLLVAGLGSPDAQAQPRPYSDRPSILSVPNRPLNEMERARLPPKWAELKRGFVRSLASMIELYPDREIYFLARDGEYLYDLAVMAAESDPSLKERIKLLNVSRGNKSSAELKAYLDQSGLSNREFEKGKKVLFVDTGFGGTMPQEIRSHIAPQFRHQTGSHFVLSTNESIPSSRIFGTEVWPERNLNSWRTSLREALENIVEEIPHYTSTSTEIRNIAGRRIPFAGPGNPDAALLMQDLAASFRTQGLDQLLSEERQFWKGLRQLEARSSKPQMVRHLKEVLAKDPSDLTKSRLVDYLNSSHTTRVHESKFVITPDDIGIEQYYQTPKGLDRLRYNPTLRDFKNYLKGPKSEIKALIEILPYIVVFGK